MMLVLVPCAKLNPENWTLPRTKYVPPEGADGKPDETTHVPVSFAPTNAPNGGAWFASTGVVVERLSIISKSRIGNAMLETAICWPCLLLPVFAKWIPATGPKIGK